MPRVGDTWLSPDDEPHVVTRVWRVAGTMLPSVVELENGSGVTVKVERRDFWRNWKDPVDNKYKDAEGWNIYDIISRVRGASK